MSGAERHIGGSCHCGNIRFELITARADSELAKRACRCTFCRQHGRVSVADPDATLRIAVADADAVNKYRFGHGTADFWVCRVCGMVPVVTADIDGRTVGLADARMMPDLAWSADELAHPDYDGEAPTDRQARRRRNWIGTVVMDG